MTKIDDLQFKPFEIYFALKNKEDFKRIITSGLTNQDIADLLSVEFISQDDYDAVVSGNKAANQKVMRKILSLICVVDAIPSGCQNCMLYYLRAYCGRHKMQKKYITVSECEAFGDGRTDLYLEMPANCLKEWYGKKSRYCQECHHFALEDEVESIGKRCSNCGEVMTLI